MSKPLLSLAAALLMSSFSGIFAQELWLPVYENNQLNTDNITTVNYVEFDQEGSMYIAETDRVNQLIVVKKRVNGQFVPLGQGVPLNMENQPFFELAIGPEGQVSLATLGTVHRYDNEANTWLSTTLESYYGGLTFLADGGLYFIHCVPHPGNEFLRDISIARLIGDEVEIATPLFNQINIIPFRNARLNRIIEHGETLYASIRRQSSNSVHVLKGSFSEGMQVLEQSALMPEFNAHNSTVYCGVADGSLAISGSGEIILSLSGNAAVGLKRYDADTDAWEDHFTEGLPEGFANIQQLRFDQQEQLHFICHFGNGLGFIFARNDDSWEHIGPSYFGESTWHNYAIGPSLAFDANNELHIIHGMGTTQNGVGTLYVRRLMDPNALRVDAFAANDVLNVYPNPARERLVLPINSHHEFGGLSISLFDVSGRRVHQQAVFGNRPEIQIGHLRAGLYHLILIDGSGTPRGHAKWVKE